MSNNLIETDQLIRREADEILHQKGLLEPSEEIWQTSCGWQLCTTIDDMERSGYLFGG